MPDVGSKACSIIAHNVVVGGDMFVNNLIQRRIVLFFFPRKSKANLYASSAVTFE